jgi:hypothetical protein
MNRDDLIAEANQLMSELGESYEKDASANARIAEIMEELSVE